MDAEVVEVPPPRSSKSPKNKEVIYHEVIDIDNDEEYSDLAVAMAVNKANKGKAIVDLSDDYSHGQEVMEDGLQASINADDLNYEYLNDDGYMDDLFVDDMMGIDDEYDELQSHFDNMDIPPGVEAPVPWMSDHSKNSQDGISSSSNSQISGSSVQDSNFGYFKEDEELKLGSSSGLCQIQINNSLIFTGYSLPDAPVNSLPDAPVKKNRQHSGCSRHISLGLESLKTRRLLEPFSKYKKSSSSSSNASMKTSDTMKIIYGGQVPNWEQTTFHMGQTMQPGVNYPRFPAPSPFVNKPTSFDQFHSHWGKYPMAAASEQQSFVEPFPPFVQPPPYDKEDKDLLQGTVADQGPSDISDVMRRFEQFKRFDTVEDHSDHHYSASRYLAGQQSRAWAKRIQEDWKMLEKDLPDTIFVRVYESRMDLMRAVIVGAEGTPYHDGLFFFDIFFPPGYPLVPPEVYYHSGGLRLNPNLYNTGKVCLSLLNTWSGDRTEQWQPKLSTMLQVLVSIQGLILNAKPYFNEPGYADSSGTVRGEEYSLKYNENTFLLSLRTMTYTMRRPPKYFEDLVYGHFLSHAKDILVACQAYMDGAQVGCLVKGVQDLEAGDKSCSAELKMTLSVYLRILVMEFERLGVKDFDPRTFLPPPSHNHNPPVDF